MKFLQSFLPSRAADSGYDDSRLGRGSSRPRDSRPSRYAENEVETAEDRAAAQALAEAEAKLNLRKELLRVVLAKTIQKTRVPAAWIGGELNPMVLPSGEEWIEVRLSVQVDEPRFLTYLTSFQAELERRLLDAAPDVREWLAGIVWTLTPDAIYEMPLPESEYWEHVQADRLLTARQKGAAEWDRESLARHFSDTNPGELVVDFEDTRPPERGTENIAEPPKD
jgi:hypothetical protein